MVVQTEKRYCTPEEYLQLEATAEFKSEYRDGEIVPMTGGTTNHNEIAGNFYARFKLTLGRPNYRVYMGDVRLWISQYRLYTYPDVMVISGEPAYEGSGTTTVTNPVLVVEVLSNSTKNYDRGDKFQYYRSIPSLREYITIDQYKCYIEQFAKNSENKWVLTEYTTADEVMTLSASEFQIQLSELYQGVNFEMKGDSTVDS
ncbi:MULTISPECIES: Uma2 family endonuclease [unclassified Microcoleus]|uniref:Uma2 family endonuclease n=1 Tax=unclassified Microcoleus TaxID=2642155 RepID=UPI001D43E5F3|nr:MULTISPECIES: Uma2 family endonuclease [unclassified Microcoleus]MCC3468882.1 Uma2 family endonuclease [Microcoleus sp. PH2017_06_SFM_O_A]MCC3502043.1 Uma2 family endonuclease [Microcoleus sp. PH2017_19_SFW_U_A]TAE16898.1 MAG: Uma2 family endonuclease [Oscillatoriales cyanobacterium]MCC3492988.1 Uma2 family endonuclease [Microcoleus sp. PH2017_16_JOR_D_A]MCC3520300.1 Uma2 family endonuclease [Microcoleus sp. PH2017_20_SFW_D_A]